MRKIFVLVFLVILTFACKKDDPFVPTLNVESENLSFSNKEEIKEVKITTNVNDWNAVSSADWCSVEVLERTLKLCILENGDLTPRDCKITITASELKKDIRVTQLGSAPDILLEKEIYKVSDKKSELSIEITTNVEIEVVPEVSWIKEKPKTRGMEVHKVELIISKNLENKGRKGTVLIKSKVSELTKSISIEQEEADLSYDPGDASSLNGDKKIEIISSEASEVQQPFVTFNSYDGKRNTYYQSLSYGSTKFPVRLEYGFSGTEQIDYLIYYPRTDAVGSFKKFELFVLCEGQSNYEKIDNYILEGTEEPQKVALKKGVKAKKIKFEIYSATPNEDENPVVSCAEIEFYQKSNYSDLSVFTDELCSELKSGVSLADIEALQNDFFRNLAISLYNKTYPKEFRIQEYKAYPSPVISASRNKSAKYSQLDNPTGIFIEEGDDIVVFVEKNSGYIFLRSIDYEKDYTSSSDYKLNEGLNKFKANQKGLLYMMYHSSNSMASPIKVHIATGKVNGYVDFSKHTNDDWNRILNQAGKYLDVLGKYSHLTFETEAFKEYASDDGKRLSEVFDSIVYLNMEFIGLQKYGKMHANRLQFVVDYKESTYMYATDYRTAYAPGTMVGICDVRKLRSSWIWGPVHEVGHVNQISAFRWLGMTEVSNNVYSLNAQTKFGNQSRIADEGEKVFNAFFTSKTIHATYSDVFVKLFPFWQLHLYYNKVKGKDFYMDLHEQFRIQPNPENSGAAQLNFIKTCCDLVQEDLTEFFQLWGLLYPVDVEIEDYSKGRFVCTEEQINSLKSHLSKYPKPNQLIQYITDNTVQLYKSNRGIHKGTYSITGKTIELNGWQNVAVFEVYSNDMMIFVSPNHRFSLKEVPSDLTIYAVASDGTRLKVN